MNKYVNKENMRLRNGNLRKVEGSLHLGNHMTSCILTYLQLTQTAES